MCFICLCCYYCGLRAGTSHSGKQRLLNSQKMKDRVNGNLFSNNNNNKNNSKGRKDLKQSKTIDWDEVNQY